jgi:predicted amidohydrolase YtcJ
MLHADLVATGGNLVTLDPTRPRATALAALDGRIVYVGDDAGARALAGPATRTAELHGRTVVPGFCDAHLHLLWYGTQLLRQADLVGVTGVDELLGRLSAHAARSEGWIQGHGFDQDRLPAAASPPAPTSTACPPHAPSSCPASAATPPSSTPPRSPR